MDYGSITYIAEELNRNNITWAVGASLMLHFHGLVASPSDMDIIVDEKDIEETKAVLSNIGELVQDGSKENNHIYLTRHFYKYQVKNVKMDVMSGFKLKHSEGIYEFQLDSHSIVSYKEINGIKIPLTSLEDWYVLYQLMQGREAKVKMIEHYLTKLGLEQRSLLERALGKEIPDLIRERIVKLLSSLS